jgi:hypothetical protein
MGQSVNVGDGLLLLARAGRDQLARWLALAEATQAHLVLVPAHAAGLVSCLLTWSPWSKVMSVTVWLVDGWLVQPVGWLRHTMRACWRS